MSSLASLEPKIILIHNKISGFKNRLETNFKIILGSTPISFGKDLAAFDILGPRARAAAAAVQITITEVPGVCMGCTPHRRANVTDGRCNGLD